MNISDLQRRLCEVPNLGEVAEAAGVSRKTVQRLKAGVPGRLANFVAVESALNRLYPKKRQRKPVEVDVVIRDDGTVVEDERRPENASQWVAVPRNRRDDPKPAHSLPKGD